MHVTLNLNIMVTDLGWIEGEGNWNFTLFIQNGRVKDTVDYKLKTALREIAEIHTGDFRLSPNQNLVIALSLIHI